MLAAALLLLVLPYGACGDHHEPAAPSAAGTVGGPAIDPSSSRIRTLVGVDLEKLPGPAGDWARGQKQQRDLQRRNQGWIQPVDIALGERRVGAKVTGEFQFKNPTGKDQVVRNITSSCGCQAVILTVNGERHEIPKAGHAPIPVPKDATGKLEAVIVVPEGTGTRFTEIRFETTDPENPVLTVGLSVLAVKDFVVERRNDAGQLEPNDTLDFGLMTARAARPFEFFVRSRDGQPFTVVRPGPLPDGMKVEFTPHALGDAALRSIWRVKGQLGPGLREQAVGGTVTFDTDRETGFEIKVFGLVMPAVRLEPALLSLPLVPAATGGDYPVQVTSVDPEDRCAIASVQLVDVDPQEPPLRVTFTNAPDGRSARVVLHVPPGLRRGKIDGRLEISFESPHLPERVVTIMGFVR